MFLIMIANVDDEARSILWEVFMVNLEWVLDNVTYHTRAGFS